MAAEILLPDSAPFALELHRAVSSGGNSVVSPYSAACAISLAYLGARGETARDIERALRGLAGPGCHARHRSAADLLREPGGVEVRSANAVWVQRGLRMLAPFAEGARGFYDAPLEAVDFAGDPESSANRINSWAREATAGRTPDLVGRLSPETRLVLTNAVYLKCRWAQPFSSALTYRGDFRLLDGSRIETPLMFKTLDVPFRDEAEARVVALPYAGGRFHMVLALPKSPDFRAFEERLIASTLSGWIDLCGEPVTTIDVSLPRLHLAFSASLNGPLASLGMARAFGPDADFTGITGPVDPENRLLISSVLQKSLLDVDEEGTEAAAATAVMLASFDACAPTKRPSFYVDRPFLFAVVDAATRTVLFLGRVEDPR